MTDHILRIKVTDEDEDEIYDFDYEIICPNEHPNETCTVWWQCDTCTDEEKHRVAREDSEFEHGKRHSSLYQGDSFVLGEQCILLSGDNDASDYGFTLGNGDHPIDYEIDDLWVYIHPIKKKEA